MFNPSTRVEHERLRPKRQAIRPQLSAQNQPVPGAAIGNHILRPIQPDAEREGSGLVSRDAQDQHLVRIRDEGFAGLPRPALPPMRPPERGTVDARGQIQFPAITGRIVAPLQRFQIEGEIGQRLVRLNSGGNTRHGPHGEIGGLVVPTREQQFPHFGQCRKCCGVRPVDVMTSPDRLFIELQRFLVDTPVDHGTQPTVADWQRLVPIPSRLPIPQG